MRWRRWAAFWSAAARRICASDFRGGGGGNFADFYRQQQIRLFSAVDAELSKAAQNAITENFAAVKKADIALQTGLGGRQKYAAMHLVGAFSASDSRAIGWQLRGFGGRDKTKGANAGLFFRTINGNLLYGANAFLDYEDGDYGDFARFGAGGELRHKYFALAANYYLPMTDERRVNATVAAFSREGYDANLRVAIPYLSFMKLRADYYHFDGKGQTAKDDGFRYGMELSPSAILRLAVYYDKGAEKVGGDIAIGYQFGEVQARQTNSPSFLRKQESPDLFAEVSREYSQRIATMAVIAANVSGIITTTRITTTTGMVTILTTMIITTGTTPPVTITMTTTEAMSVTITTTTTATRTPVTTTATLETNVASVHFRARYDYSRSFAGTDTPHWIVVESLNKYRLTLPPVGQRSNPTVVRVTGSLDRPGHDFVVRVVGGPIPGYIQNVDYSYHETDYAPEFMRHTLTVIEGSEEFVGEPVTLVNASIIIATTRITTTTTAMAITTTAAAIIGPFISIYVSVSVNPVDLHTVTITTHLTPLTMTSETIAPSRLASVQISFFVADFDPDVGFGAADFVFRTNQAIHLVTLPDTARPWVVTLQGPIRGPVQLRIISVSRAYAVGVNFPLLDSSSTAGGQTIVATVVQGSEIFVSVRMRQIVRVLPANFTSTTTTSITTTITPVVTASVTITTAAVSTTTTLTAFSTTTVTIGANSAMGAMPPNFYPPLAKQGGGCEFAKGKVAGGAFGICRSPKAQRPPPESAFALSPPPMAGGRKTGFPPRGGGS